MKGRHGSSRLGCSIHPQEQTVGVCASCLRDRLGGISAQKPEAKFQHSKSRVEIVPTAVDDGPWAHHIRRSRSFSESFRVSGRTRSLKTVMQEEDLEHGIKSHTLLSLFRMDDMDNAGDEQELLYCKIRPFNADRKMNQKKLNAQNGDGMIPYSLHPPDQKKSKNDTEKEQQNRAQKNNKNHTEKEQQNRAQKNNENLAENDQNSVQQTRENHAENKQNIVQKNSENCTEKENEVQEKIENHADREQQNRVKWNRICTEAFHRRMRAFRIGRQTETEQYPRQVHNNNNNNNNNNSNNIPSSKQIAPPSPKYSMWSGYFNPVQTYKSSHNRKEESLERSRTISSVSPRNIENGLLRFYLTPLRTRKSRHRARRTGVRAHNLWG